MSATARPLNGHRILVVEDEYIIAIQLKRWLQDAGADVLGPVPSAHQALSLVGQHKIDAAVLDINLGLGGTAFPVADRLGELGVPYLFATGDVRLANGSAYSDRPRLEKPYVGPEVVRAVVELVLSPRQVA